MSPSQHCHPERRTRSQASSFAVEASQTPKRIAANRIPRLARNDHSGSGNAIFSTDQLRDRGVVSTPSRHFGAISVSRTAEQKLPTRQPSKETARALHFALH